MTDNTDQPHRNLIQKAQDVIANTDPARAATAVGVALIVGIFAALGIEGDLLIRMVRNLPVLVSISFAAVILGLTLPLFASNSSEVGKRWVEFIGLGLVVGGSLLAIGVAAYSMEVREQPSLKLTPDWSTTVPGEATLSIEATALSLQAKEDVLMRVVGVKGINGVNVKDVCGDPQWLQYGDTRAETVLVWSTSGPAVNGTAIVSTSLPVSVTQYDYICAYAGLRDRDKNTVYDDRWALSILDLHRETTGVNATPTAAPPSLPAVSP